MPTSIATRNHLFARICAFALLVAGIGQSRGPWSFVPSALWPQAHVYGKRSIGCLPRSGVAPRRAHGTATVALGGVVAILANLLKSGSRCVSISRLLWKWRRGRKLLFRRGRGPDMVVVEEDSMGTRYLVLGHGSAEQSVFTPGTPSRLVDKYWDSVVLLETLVPSASCNAPFALIGLGGGTSARILRSLCPAWRLVAWECNEVVLEASRAHLGLGELEAQGGLAVTLGDGLLRPQAEERSQFMGVVVDLFDGEHDFAVPELGRPSGWRGPLERLHPDGILLANLGWDWDERSDDGREVLRVVRSALRGALRREESRGAPAREMWVKSFRDGIAAVPGGCRQLLALVGPPSVHALLTAPDTWAKLCPPEFDESGRTLTSAEMTSGWNRVWPARISAE